MVRLLKNVWPNAAPTAFVPPRVPPPGDVPVAPIAIVTTVVWSPLMRLPKASVTSTSRRAFPFPRIAPPLMLPAAAGLVIQVSLAAAPALTTKPLLVTVARFGAVAASTYEPDTLNLTSEKVATPLDAATGVVPTRPPPAGNVLATSEILSVA